MTRHASSSRRMRSWPHATTWTHRPSSTHREVFCEPTWTHAPRTHHAELGCRRSSHGGSRSWMRWVRMRKNNFFRSKFAQKLMLFFATFSPSFIETKSSLSLESGAVKGLLEKISYEDENFSQRFSRKSSAFFANQARQIAGLFSSKKAKIFRTKAALFFARNAQIHTAGRRHALLAPSLFC